jgi:putative ABC transport system permease protein
MRESVRPTVYVPVHATDEKTGGLRPQDWGTFVVRTSASNPTVLAPMLRREVTRARPELRVSSIRTQTELVEQHTIRERLLATLSLFFAMVALVLAGVGLYGVLNYSVLQRQREIGIRMALGARASHVAWRVTAEVFGMLLLGAIAGFAAGAVTEHYVETLLYQVKATEVTLWVLPALTIFMTALLAVLPPIVHAVRIDPAKTLRAE